MKAKYALRALIVLCASGKKMAGKAIAKEADVPSKFLEAILNELKHNGVIESKRGIFGGYVLAKPADGIMVGEVVRLIDGTLAPLRCASTSDYRKCDDCQDETICVIRKVMVDVKNAISRELDHRSLAELIALSPERKRNVFW